MLCHVLEFENIYFFVKAATLLVSESYMLIPWIRDDTKMNIWIPPVVKCKTGKPGVPPRTG